MPRAAPLASLVPVALVVVLASACAPASPEPSPPSSTTDPTGAPSAASTDGSTASPPTTAAWTAVADAPVARLEMATAAHDGRIWMAGGLSPLGEALADVEVFDPATGEWTDGPSLPTGVHHAALVSDGDRLLFVGGYVGADFNAPTDLVLVLADGDDAWQPGPSLPQARGAGTAAWDGARVIYGGGVGPGGVAGDVFALEGDAWTRIGAMPRAREHLAATSDGQGRTWLLGGRVGGLDANLADVDVVVGDEITALEPLPTPRGGVGAFYLPETGACLTGGEAPAEAYTEVECIDGDGTVTTGPPMAVRRHGHGAAVIDGVVYVLLGGPTPGLSAHASVERLDPTP